MSAPVNTAKVINHVMQRDPVIDNDLLIKLAGGSLEQWAPSLKGHRAGCIVQSVNPILEQEGFALASEGVRSEKWRLVSVAEAHRRNAEFNLRRIDAHYRNAYADVEAIALDMRAPKRMRIEAKAWLQLFEEPRTEMGLEILLEFAIELADVTSRQREIKLVT